MSSPPTSRPVLPQPAALRDGAVAADALRELRRFHLGLPRKEPVSGITGKLFPASLRALIEARPSTVRETELEAPLALFFEAAREILSPARATGRHEALELASCGRALLGDVDGRATGGAGATESLGSLGSRFVDPSSLSEMLGSAGSGGDARVPRERLEQALDALEPLADEGRPELILIHSGEPPAALPSSAEGVDVVVSGDPPAAAAEQFDRHAEALARALSAVRLLRLVTSGEYRAELHDPWLEQLDWQGFTRDELHLLPQVVAVLAAEQAGGPGMASLSRLLLSGRPVQVFVFQPPLAEPGDSGFRFEPATFGLGHREALVRQTSPARPGHMAKGFSRALAATRTALHVIAGASSAREVPVDVYSEGRAHPLFHYDPEAGSGWAERFDLSANPQPEEDWPFYELVAERATGGEEILRLPVTFADVALLDPAHARHFTLIPENVADHQLLSVAAYCAHPPADEISEIPYLWVVDDRSRLRRVAISRALALACRDRLGTWRALQEFGGIGSGYVRQAAREARRIAEQQAAEELAGVKANAAAELERTRYDAARDVVDRLTAALLDIDPSSLAGAESPDVTSGATAPRIGVSSFLGADVDQVSEALLGLLEDSGRVKTPDRS